MAVSVLDVITAALVKIRVHRPGSAVPPEDVQDAVSELQRMLKTRRLVSQLVYRVEDVLHPLTASIRRQYHQPSHAAAPPPHF